MKVINPKHFNMKFIEIIKQKKNYLITGRAATGIYLILNDLKIKQASVLVPANICYAAIFPIYESGHVPVFCDTDKASGNVTYDIIKDSCTNDIKVMIIPHMYGNPVLDISKIADFCKRNHIILIEDCASSLGAKVGEELVGSYGDYAIYSFGYSKTIDLGCGSLILSNNNLENMKLKESELPYWNETKEKDEQIFSQIYRVLRNNAGTNIEFKLYTFLRKNFKHIFLSKASYEIIQNIINIKEEDLRVLQKRCENVELYNRNIKFRNSIINAYMFHEGAVPWRYNLFIEPKYKERFINEMLKLGIPISDWYPSIAKMFGDMKIYNGIDYFENRIVNFPLLIEKQHIIKICEQINKILDKAGD